MLFIHSLNTVQTDWWAESVGVAEHVYIHTTLNTTMDNDAKHAKLQTYMYSSWCR